MSIPDFGSNGADALPPLGEDVPDPAHVGRRSTADPDTELAWPERDVVVATGRDDRRTHVVDPGPDRRARCGAAVAGVAPGWRADCPECAPYP